jgi:hypothetical protein
MTTRLDEVLERLRMAGVEVLFSSRRGNAAASIVEHDTMVIVYEGWPEEMTAWICGNFLSRVDRDAARRARYDRQILGEPVPPDGLPSPEDFLGLALRAAPDGLSLADALRVAQSSGGGAKTVAAIREASWVTETRERRPDMGGTVRELTVLRAKVGEPVERRA